MTMVIGFIVVIVLIVIVVKAWKVFAALIALGLFWGMVGVIWLMAHYDLGLFA